MIKDAIIRESKQRIHQSGPVPRFVLTASEADLIAAPVVQHRRLDI